MGMHVKGQSLAYGWGSVYRSLQRNFPMWTPPHLSNFYMRAQFPLNIWVPSINCFGSEQKGTISSPWFLSFHTWGVSLWDEKGETIKFLLTGSWIHRHTQTPLLCSRDLGAYISRGGRTAYSKTSLGGQKVPSPSSFIPLSQWHHFYPSHSGHHHGTFVQMEATPSSRPVLPVRTSAMMEIFSTCVFQYSSH